MRLLNALFSWPQWAKVGVQYVWDAGVICFSFLFAYMVRVGLSAYPVGQAELVLLLGISVFTLTALQLLGHYRQILRYLAPRSFLPLAVSLIVSVTLLYIAGAGGAVFMPMSVPILFLAFAGIGMGGPRLLIMLTTQWEKYGQKEKCLIFGAEHAGRSLAMALNQGFELQPVAFVDAKQKYLGSSVMGLPVVDKAQIPKLVTKYNISKILLAVNNTSAKRRKELLAELEPFALELLTVPDVTEVASGKRKISELREVKIEELLGREPVPPIADLLSQNIAGKHVMVTGAGGSIGSELCRQIARGKPASLTLYELSEFNLYQIEHELKGQYPNLVLHPVLASIQDNDVLRSTIECFNIQTIYHAAAYKHVPMVEHNITAGIRNNIFGTANTALVAAEYQVEKFVLVSTDKAVRPTNIMGATKRFAELFVQGLAELNSETEFAIVRFGNVLGSSGSVVPVFDRQIRQGGPITVTHPDIIRYFMTIPEAAQLVIQAGAMGSDGEVFVLDMGPPVKITDLAVKMAHLMGLTVKRGKDDEGDIELVFSGLRPGEKLYEELLIDDAETQTAHPRIMGANEVRIPFSDVVMLMDRINYALTQNNESEARDLLLEAPLAYAPTEHKLAS
ncbi:polysaccharide biosynthesis protein [Alteromonas sediminis]|uniref:Polysaccharide biosynthesis protein n=1 Tax=Alteromonas sediminis TaxID=2259342 RepID=A0A3N5YE24_9ALTE|nr:nucleoside-diphosphate sugar epimerase/dehydratase [Alteromonas sediminis]RPJ67855.1 polysaccharide biosynthesis protein [Alteromonas sediminis]